MDKLVAMQRDFAQEGLSLDITGLDTHQQLSRHERAARKRGLAKIRRLTIVTDAVYEHWLEQEFVKRGASGYTVIPCLGAGLRSIAGNEAAQSSQVRIEVIVTNEVCERILDFLRREVQPEHHMTACVEIVEVLRIGQFRVDDAERLTGVAGASRHDDHGA
jgi:nitrogen regulatory protein PII